MKVLIINGSHRTNGNTTIFSNYAQNVFKHNNIDAEIVNLIDYRIDFCSGCLLCEDIYECNIQDDFNLIVDKIKDSSLLFFVTPSYFNMPTARMKNFIDRTNVLCNYFENNKKLFSAFVVGQTDSDSCIDVYNYIKKYADIMYMDSVINEPIIAIARDAGELQINDQILLGLKNIIHTITK